MPTILIVHANLHESERLRRALEQSGSIVERLAEADAVPAVATGRFDAALLSASPGETGYLLADRLRLVQPKLPVAMLVQPGARVERLRAGPRPAQAYLDRATSPEAVAE